MPETPDVDPPITEHERFRCTTCGYECDENGILPHQETTQHVTGWDGVGEQRVVVPASPGFDVELPEPDFDQIARDLLDAIDEDFTFARTDRLRATVAEQFRQVWNARGGGDEALLRKYMAFIVVREGDNYLDSLDAPEYFSDAELAELRRIAAD